MQISTLDHAAIRQDGETDINWRIRIPIRKGTKTLPENPEQNGLTFNNEIKAKLKQSYAVKTNDVLLIYYK